MRRGAVADSSLHLHQRNGGHLPTAALASPPDPGATSHWWTSDGQVVDGVAQASLDAFRGSETLDQGTGTDQPVGATVGGLVVLDCDGGGDHLDLNVADVAQPWTIGVVFRLDTLPSAGGMMNPFALGGSGAGAFTGVLTADGNEGTVADEFSVYAGTVINTGIATATATWYMGIFVGDGASSRWVINGSTGTGDAGTRSIEWASIGASAVGSNDLDGKVAEAWYGSGDLWGTSTLDGWMTWCASRYGVATP